MSWLAVGYISILVLLLFLAIGMPVGLALMAVGIGCIFLFAGGTPVIAVLATVPFLGIATYLFTIMPLFIIMGQFAFFGGQSDKLFNLAQTWFGNVRGGLALATTISCAGFAAMCGSSLATAAAIGKVAIGQMRRFGYNDELSTGCVAAAGTMGILIPPSMTMVIYGLVTQTSIGRLMIAGFLPGFLEASLYMVMISIWCHTNPRIAPQTRGARPLKEKVLALKSAWGMSLTIGVIFGGVYTGIMTPTEAGGVGALVTFILFLTSGRFNLKQLWESLLETGKVTCLSMFIIAGALVYGVALSYSGVPEHLCTLIIGLGLPLPLMMGVFCVMYIILGMFMEPIAIILVTMPIVFPAVVALGVDPVWFGIMIVSLVEMAVLTPPLGEVVYVIVALTPDVSASVVFKGVSRFLVMDLVRLGLMIAFPQIILVLPNMMR